MGARVRPAVDHAGGAGRGRAPQRRPGGRGWIARQRRAAPGGARAARAPRCAPRAQDRVPLVWSAPHRLRVHEQAVRQVTTAVLPFAFDRMYGGWWEPVLRSGAREVLQSSADRYIEFLRGEAQVG